tara:strand:+ start:155 stop:748 length:594 start_codon:yes stop_codon:yes gene_type:complete
MKKLKVNIVPLDELKERVRVVNGRNLLPSPRYPFDQEENMRQWCISQVRSKAVQKDFEQDCKEKGLEVIHIVRMCARARDKTEIIIKSKVGLMTSRFYRELDARDSWYKKHELDHIVKFKHDEANLHYGFSDAYIAGFDPYEKDGNVSVSFTVGKYRTLEENEKIRGESMHKMHEYFKGKVDEANFEGILNPCNEED